MRPTEITGAAVAAVGLVALAAFFVVRYLRNRPTPAELERRRRADINSRGKIGDGEVIDVEGVAVLYSYHVGGVGYEAAQDVSSLESYLPPDLMSMIGPVSIKYDPRNPANSIVICESWSGLRV